MNQKIFKLFLFVITLLFVKGDTFKVETEIFDLDLPQIEEALETYEHVIVLFQDKENSEQSQIYFNFLKTALPKLKELYTNPFIGKVVIEDTQNIPKYYKFTEYPALAYFYRGKKNTFTKGLDLERFFSWIINTSQTKIGTLKNQVEFDQFLEEDTNPKIVAFYKNEDEAEIKIIKDLVEQDYLQVFDIYKVALCLEGCEVTFKNISFSRPSLTIFREYDKVEPVALKRKGLDDIMDILEFINKESVPLVIELDEVNMTKLFAGYATTGIILFVDPLKDNQQVIKEFEASALQNRKDDLYYERVLHSVYQFDDQWEEMKNFFSQFDRTKLPKLFITHLTDDGITKYEFKKDQINLEEIRGFLEDFRKKNLERLMISEEIPDNEGKDIKILVGKNFQKEVVNTKENFVVLFHDDENSEGAQLVLKLFNFVREKLINLAKGLSEEEAIAIMNRLKFGYIDMLRNEVAHRSFTRYPQVMLYMKGKKNRPSEFDLPLTPKAFIAWLNSMLPELQLSITDAEEAEFIAGKYSSSEKEEYEKLKKILDAQKEKLDEELKKIEEAEEMKKAEKNNSEDKKEEPQEILSLGGPSIDLPKTEVKKEEVKKEKTQTQEKSPKKKSETNNIDL